MKGDAAYLRKEERMLGVDQRKSGPTKVLIQSHMNLTSHPGAGKREQDEKIRTRKVATNG